MRELARLLARFAAHDSSVGNRARALGRFTFRQLHKRIVRRPLLVDWEGLRLEVPVDAKAAAAAYYLGRYESWELDFLERFLRPGDTALDVGANVGIYSMFIGKLVAPGGRVFAFEPDPLNFARLEANLRRNRMDWVRPRRAAVGPVDGTARFLDGRDCVGRLSESDEGIEVPVVALDGLALRPLYAKVDVEGFEDGVLRGATRMMESGFPLVWQLEMLAATAAGKQQSILETLAAYGYRPFAFSWREGLVPVDPCARSSQNFLAIRDPGFVRERLGNWRP